MQSLPRQSGSSDYHFAHVRDFVECLSSRKKPIADVEIGHKSVIACHLGNIAARLRTQVRWDAKNEKILGDPKAAKMVSKEYRAPWKLPKV
jgi:hypothetical protein